MYYHNGSCLIIKCFWLSNSTLNFRCALKEMELGLNLLMEEYRKTVTGFMKSDRLHEYAQESDERVSYFTHIIHN